MIKIYSNNGKISYDVKEYIVDTEEDINNIPENNCGAGSVIFVTSTCKFYFKNNEGKWVEV